jgi:hypothetical protein
MGNFAPNHIFDSVDQKLARKKYLYPFLALTGVSASSKILPNISVAIQTAIKGYDSNPNYHFSQELISYALAFSLVGLIFIIMVVASVFDAQISITIAKCLFLDSFLFITSGLLLLLPNDITLLIKVTVIICLVLGLVQLFLKGNFTFYYLEEYYGDAIIEVIVIISFTAFLVKPIIMLFNI